MKSVRLYLRLILTFISKFKLILILGIIVGIVAFMAFSKIVPTFEITKQTIGVIGEYSVDDLPISITSLISSGLTKTNERGEVSPAIAESYEAKDSGQTWTFHINKNMKWQDGATITSKDINYNFSDATVEKPDKFTVIFKLKTPLSNFPVIVSKPIFKVGLLGTGEWKVKNLSLAGSFVETLELENSDKIKLFKFYPSEERAKLAYQLGQINYLQNLMNPAPFDTWDQARVTPIINKNQYVAVFFNTTNTILADKEVRQALSYAIDKKSLSENRALGPISPNSWGYNPTIKPYDFDIKHAKTLFQESKIPEDDKKHPKIKLSTIPALLSTAEKIVKNWKDIGIDATLQVTQFIPDDYQAFLGIYDIPIDPDQYFAWHHTQLQTNISKYSNPRIDKLLEDGRLETNESKRKSIYLDFQKYLLEDAPAAFLYYPTYYNVERK